MTLRQKYRSAGRKVGSLSRSNGSIINHIDVHILISRDKLGLVFMAAIMGRLQFVPHNVAIIVHIAFIDGCGHDLSHHHQTMKPLLCPLDLALEMTSAFTNARRLNNRRGERREPGFLELIHAGREFKPNDPYLFKNLPLKGRNIDDKFLGCQNIIVRIFGGPGCEGNVHWIVTHSHTGAIRRGVDPALEIHRGDHNETSAWRKQSIPMRHRHVDLFVHGFTSIILWSLLPISILLLLVGSENTRRKGFGYSYGNSLERVIPAWSAGIQVDMDVSVGILASLDAGNPCRHTGDSRFYLL